MSSISPTPIPYGARRRIQASTRLLHEWSKLQPWLLPPIYELRLGPTPLTTPGTVLTPALERQLSVFNRYSDLVGPMPTELLVVEAKMVADPGAQSQLQHYLDLVRVSKLPTAWPYLPIQGVLLWAVDDPIIHQRAVAAGIRIEIFTPPWVADYLNLKYFHR